MKTPDKFKEELKNSRIKATKLYRQYRLRDHGHDIGFIALSPESVRRYLNNGWVLTRNQVSGNLLIKR